MTRTGADPRVETLVGRVQALARAQGRPDLADALQWRLDVLADAPPLTVVVAGRSNSGKSTLINALLGRPLLAHGFDVPTSVPAVIDADLYELRIVDTPGLDAVEAEPRAHAVEQVLRADVLLFVFDAEAPVSRSEIRFLEAAAGALADVVLLIGKADVAVDLDRVVAADRHLLATIAPRWADARMLPVSGLEKMLADRTGDAQLADESGVPALERLVSRRLAPNLGVVRSAALVQACRSVVAELAAAADGTLRGGDGSGALADDAVARHRRYVEATELWTADFGRDYQRRTRQVIERELRLRLLEGRELREVAIKSGAVALEEVTAEVKADLSRIAAEIDAALVEQVAALMSDWTVRLELGSVHLPTLAGFGPAEFDMPAVDVAGTTWQARENVHGLAGLVNLARSVGSGRSLAGLLPGGLAVGTGVGLVMTGLSWGTSEWLRHKVQDQQGALAFVHAAFARAQIELESALREHALELQPVAQTAIQRNLDARRQELALDAARLQQRAADEAADRERARGAAGERLTELAPWRELLDALGDRFTAFLRDGVEPLQLQSTNQTPGP